MHFLQDVSDLPLPADDGSAIADDISIKTWVWATAQPDFLYIGGFTDYRWYNKVFFKPLIGAHFLFIDDEPKA